MSPTLSCLAILLIFALLPFVHIVNADQKDELNTNDVILTIGTSLNYTFTTSFQTFTLNVPVGYRTWVTVNRYSGTGTFMLYRGSSAYSFNQFTLSSSVPSGKALIIPTTTGTTDAFSLTVSTSVGSVFLFRTYNEPLTTYDQMSSSSTLQYDNPQSFTTTVLTPKYLTIAIPKEKRAVGVVSIGDSTGCDIQTYQTGNSFYASKLDFSLYKTVSFELLPTSSQNDVVFDVDVSSSSLISVCKPTFTMTLASRNATVSSDTNVGAIVGGIIGALIGFCCLVALIVGVIACALGGCCALGVAGAAGAAVALSNGEKGGASNTTTVHSTSTTSMV